MYGVVVVDDGNVVVVVDQVVGRLAVHVLECRVRCVKEMGEFRNDQKEDFFGSYFHYLQQGYHKCKYMCTCICDVCLCVSVMCVCAYVSVMYVCICDVCVCVSVMCVHAYL